MKIIFNLKFYKYKLRDKLSTFVALIVLIAIIFLLSFSIKSYLNLKNQVNQTSKEVNQLKNRVVTLKLNKSLSQGQIEDYIKLLSTLIPETEDYFSIIYSLENISRNSGFIIDSYSINLAVSNKEKITIIIGGQGDPDSFINFLKNYKFAGGRLITIEKIQFSSTVSSKNKISVNFYNKKFEANENFIPQLDKKDIKLLEDIKNKTSIIFKLEETETISYPTKSNPF